ncbi:MAG: cytochrome c biogenesis protein CcdA [Isosphaeraceae bacterium]|nr:cytochrome c biogenesis protein CcdA [Isosphaeraceae bacterium]
MRLLFSRRLLPLGGTLMVSALLVGLIAMSQPRSVRADGEAKPAKKDSKPFFKPKGVTMTPSVTPREAKAGDTVTYQIDTKLAPGWHIYKYAKQDPDSGPRATKFDFFDTAGLKIVGDWTASKDPILKQEPAFDNQVLSFYEDEVAWTIKLQVPPGTKPGKKVLRVQAGYQICDPQTCSTPGQWTLPDVELTVLPGGAEATTGAEAGPAPTDTAVAQAAGAASAAVAAKPEVLSEVAQKARQGIVPFLLASALGGLLALVMPCVWPMVPITVNFFVKQGHSQKGKSTVGLAVTYCLAIIGVFTTVGVLCAFFFSASSLQRLANNPWLNFAVAGLFIAFGLSLLGLFEISLPNFLLNASAHGENRGGLIGVMFMALTLTITSFTCTFPVVGGLLVMAAGGEFFYPIVGLATFSAVLALPFFLLALAPGLLSKMPKSGDWMNAVKVIGGLVEIGAAFKFLNTAELAFSTPENAWIDAQVVLSVWVVLAAVCGIYLLGLFRTDHDHEEVKVGPGRLVLGSSFLAFALFLAPALFGRPPQSLVWDRLIVGLLPPDAGELEGGGSAPREPGAGRVIVKGDATDPKSAVEQAETFHGVTWGMSYEAALRRAKAEKKPILIDFTGVNCANCRLMEKRVLPRPEVVKRLGEFVTVQLYTDFVPIASLSSDQRQELAEKNIELESQLAKDTTQPFYVALSPDGELLNTIGGYREPSVFLGFLDKALGKLPKGDKVAQTGPTE